MREIKIDLPLSNQFDGEHDSAWAHRICALCSLHMLLKHRNPGFAVPVMDLVRQGLAHDAYLENIGWKHAGIVQLAAEYGLKLQYAQRFYYSPEEREEGMLKINQNLETGQPVIISIFHELNPAKGAHMVVVHGLQEFGGSLIGYHIQDPDARFRGHNYFLTKEEFLSGWRGGLISRTEI